MSDTAALLLPDGKTAGPGPVLCDLPAEGLRLRLKLPPGRSLATFSLRIAAPQGAVHELPAALVSERGGFPADGNKIAWLRASLPQERAIAGIRLEGDKGNAARLRVFSRGIWRPLTPPDMVALAVPGEAPMVSLTPVAASAVMAEFQSGFTPAPNAPQVFLPAACGISGMAVFGTAQPCHVAVSLGTEPAFLTYEGPLPVVPVAVEGLLRAANRYLADNAGPAEIPLCIIAAAPGQIVLQDFSAILRPPVPQDDKAGARPAPPVEQLKPDITPAAGAAQLCDAAHLVAQRLEPPLCDETIASLRLYLAAGAGPVQGAITWHGGAAEPDPHPLPGQPEMPFPAFSAAPGWAAVRLPQPWKPGRAVWLVCRITAGEAFWFTAAQPRPVGLGALLTSSGGGPWAAAAAGWAFLRLGVVPGG